MTIVAEMVERDPVVPIPVTFETLVVIKSVTLVTPSVAFSTPVTFTVDMVPVLVVFDCVATVVAFAAGEVVVSTVVDSTGSNASRT